MRSRWILGAALVLAVLLAVALLAGTLGVQFRIAGEPDVGGLVDEISLMEDYSTIQQASMRECVTESLYALELDPPPEGGSAERQVTLRFEPE